MKDQFLLYDVMEESEVSFVHIYIHIYTHVFMFLYIFFCNCLFLFIWITEKFLKAVVNKSTLKTFVLTFPWAIYLLSLSDSYQMTESKKNVQASNNALSLSTTSVRLQRVKFLSKSSLEYQNPFLFPQPSFLELVGMGLYPFLSLLLVKLSALAGLMPVILVFGRLRECFYEVGAAWTI